MKKFIGFYKEDNDLNSHYSIDIKQYSIIVYTYRSRNKYYVYNNPLWLGSNVIFYEDVKTIKNNLDDIIKNDFKYNERYVFSVDGMYLPKYIKVELLKAYIKYA